MTASTVASAPTADYMDVDKEQYVSYVRDSFSPILNQNPNLILQHIDTYFWRREGR